MQTSEIEIFDSDRQRLGAVSVGPGKMPAAEFWAKVCLHFRVRS